jgi:hypothetical protein
VFELLDVSRVHFEWTLLIPLVCEVHASDVIVDVGSKMGENMPVRIDGNCLSGWGKVQILGPWVGFVPIVSRRPVGVFIRIAPSIPSDDVEERLGVMGCLLRQNVSSSMVR